MYMVTHYFNMNASHGGEVHECNHSKLQCRDLHLTVLNACNFTGQHFEIINHCLVSNAHINYACWLRCTHLAVNLLEHIFSRYHWLLTADNLQHFWTLSCLCLFVTTHCPLCLDLDKESSRSVIQERSFGSCCQWWMLEVREDSCPVAVDHTTQK